MKKTVFQCVSNAVLFTLFGLTFLFPFSETVQVEGGFGGAVSIFPIILIIALIVYPVTYQILAKRNKWGKKDDTELAYSDEREKIIVAESTKTAYKILTGGLIVIIAAIGGAELFSINTGIEISTYVISIALMTALLDAATISYCVKWCVQYKK